MSSSSKQPLWHRLGRMWAYWRVSRKQSKLSTVNVTETLSSRDNVVVLAPSHRPDLHAALKAVERMRSWWPLLQVVHLITNKTRDVATLPADDFLVRESANGFGLPTKSAVKAVYEMAPTIVIDMNRRYCLHSAYLAVKSGAPLRIGFRIHPVDFFNLAYGVLSEDKSAEAVYTDLVDTLAALSGRTR